MSAAAGELPADQLRDLRARSNHAERTRTYSLPKLGPVPTASLRKSSARLHWVLDGGDLTPLDDSQDYQRVSFVVPSAGTAYALTQRKPTATAVTESAAQLRGSCEPC